MVVLAPGASSPFCSVLVAVTAEPSGVQVALHPLPKLCQPVGQLNARVQPSIGSAPVLLMSRLAT